MTQNDSRAFRAHLSGGELIRAQERFIAALLRSPGSVAVVRVAGLTKDYFPPQLADARVAASPLSGQVNRNLKFEGPR
jgi:hypothetical protein